MARNEKEQTEVDLAKNAKWTFPSVVKLEVTYQDWQKNQALLNDGRFWISQIFFTNNNSTTKGKLVNSHLSHKNKSNVDG